MNKEKECKSDRCENIVTNPRRLYCCDECRKSAAYWRNATGTGRKRSPVQDMRMARAARRQKYSSVRYN